MHVVDANQPHCTVRTECGIPIHAAKELQAAGLVHKHVNDHAQLGIAAPEHLRRNNRNDRVVRVIVAVYERFMITLVVLSARTEIGNAND
jgi:hypothetical protein